jgi:UTP--glucose-1-phosphate uridylyltransferase
MVEKPKSNPPSRYAIIGRYILPPDIFAILEKTERGAGSEIQLTDALRQLVKQGDFYGYVFEGRRYDAGEKLGYLKATVDYALRHPKLGAEFRTYLQDLFGNGETFEREEAGAMGAAGGSQRSGKRV